jgi:hypothetical protein
MKYVKYIVGGLVAILSLLLFRDKAKLFLLFKKQDKEIKSSEEKLEGARNEIESAKEGLKSTADPVEDLTDPEVEEYWKNKLKQ